MSDAAGKPSRENPSARAPRRRPINLSGRAFAQLAAALGVATLASAARADWTLLTADFQSQQHLTVNTWTPEQGLSATGESGKLTRIASREIVSLDSGRKVRTDGMSRQWKLTMRNGDQLLGESAGVSGQSLLFSTPDLGQVAIPLKGVASLAGPKFDSSMPAPPASERDVVRLANNDRVDGIVANVDSAKLQVVTDNPEQPLQLPLNNVAVVYFGGATPPRTVPPLSVRLRLISGSVMTVPLAGGEKGPGFSWSINNLTIRDSAGTEHPVKIDSVAKIEVLGGRVAYLTELDPVSEEQTTFLDTSWPMQVNKNVLGQPLKVARAEYPRGIGVHTRSTVTYELDGSFDTLSLRVGLDDSAAPTGEAKAVVALDGKVLWESGVLKPGQAPPELKLPIKGGKRLQLSALPVSHLDVLGRVDWLNVALLRP